LEAKLSGTFFRFVEWHHLMLDLFMVKSQWGSRNRLLGVPLGASAVTCSTGSISYFRESWVHTSMVHMQRLLDTFAGTPTSKAALQKKSRSRNKSGSILILKKGQ